MYGMKILVIATLAMGLAACAADDEHCLASFSETCALASQTPAGANQAQCVAHEDAKWSAHMRSLMAEPSYAHNRGIPWHARRDQ